MLSFDIIAVFIAAGFIVIEIESVGLLNGIMRALGTLLAWPATFSVVSALISPDGTGRLPAMGWSSWNEYEDRINETVFIRVAELLNELGLKDKGYQYVNIDDAWSDKVQTRDNHTDELRPDYSKFPRGIAHTAARVHELGLKLGIYGDAGGYILETH